jgi:hypothetical protein
LKTIIREGLAVVLIQRKQDHKPFGLSLACPELVEGSKSSLFLLFAVCLQAGGCPAATHFLFASPKRK